MCGLVLLYLLLLLQTDVHGFKILTDSSISHEAITERAILKVTAQACRSLALAEGRDFTFPSEPFTATSIAAACEAQKSTKSFLSIIGIIQKKNWSTDVRHVLDPEYHFDDETFAEGKKIITDGLNTIRQAIKNKGPRLETEKLGEILHPLQDFYSHSNWVEIGNTVPNSNLVFADRSIGNIAAKTRGTCRNCEGDVCRNNILEDILKEKLLTSGYFSPFSSKKLPGKCSHGGSLDQTRNTVPTGGINKDTFDSSHGYLHQQAADLAIAATSELLEEIRLTAGDKQFLQMMGLTRGKPLCFVVDTTGSMGDDIAAVRTVTASIIDSKVGTEDEPSVYILVPFNDPDFGPLKQTTDPEVFKSYINALVPNGGGDFPEMSLSGLQLALTGSPHNSEIFLFTDATAKDEYLKNTVIALIEQTKSVVTFMLTNLFGARRRRQVDNSQQQLNHRMLGSDTQLYRELAQASGGQAIEVTKGQLLGAISIIKKSISSSLVTLLQVTRTPGKAENVTFTVDESMTNLTIYITGSSVDFTLISPSGVPQNPTNITGSSIISYESVGNFKTLQMQIQVGVWEMRMLSSNPYSVKVVGESPIDFLFDFLKEVQGPLGGFDLVDNRPPAGVNGSLMVTLTNGAAATVTEVILVETSGSGKVDGRVEVQGEGKYFVRFDRIPSAEFVILIKGQNTSSTSRSSSSVFQRQSTTNLRASTLTVTAGNSDVLEPGTTISVPFSVITSGTGGTFSIQVTNDRGFDSISPSTLFLETGGSANGTVNLTAPSNTLSGTGVTLTIRAESPGSTDINYAVLRLTVLTRVTDFTKPVCQLLSLQSNCSDNCTQSLWELSVLVTDGANGTGVDSITLREGNGTLNTSAAASSNNVTLVNYTASCCSPDVQLVVVDRVGNGETCSFSVRANPTQAVPTSVRPSTITVTAGVLDTSFEPGATISVPFSVITSGPGGNFSIQATNDRGFNLSYPSTLFLETGLIANSTVNLTAPSNTPSGTNVTLTIQVVAPGGTDINYAVFRLTVLTKVTDPTQAVPTSSPQNQTVAVTSFSTRAVQSVTLCISITVLGLSLSSEMWIN